MKGSISLLVVALFLCESSAAQWPNYPSPGVPRLPDGRPDLKAPPPRSTDGKPDLSGIWILEATVDPGFLGLPYGPAFLNIGASLEGGLPYQPWAAERVAETSANLRAKDPLSNCLPIGPVRSHTIPSYRRMIQLPDKILLLNEYNSSFRVIFTDGRALPADPIATLTGYSTGKWVDDRLVVETTGFRDRAVWLDAAGSPLTNAAKITERFRRTSLGELEIELTVDDLKAYTRPWTVTLHQKLAPDIDLVESFCSEEELVTLQEAER